MVARQDPILTDSLHGDDVTVSDRGSGVVAPALETAWSRLQHGEFSGINGVTIGYGFLAHDNPRQAIVICNGRLESYLKYQELACELFAQGYSIYMLDHRGQGLSGRLTDNRHKGHVDHFGDYVADFGSFVEHVVKPRGVQKLYLLAHSMGAAIASRYLQQGPHTFRAAVFSAPMFGIQLPAPVAVIRLVARSLDKLSSLCGSEPGYVIGGGDYHAVPFEDNELTHSVERYQAFRTLYQAKPELQLGGPTNRWLLEAMGAAKQCIMEADTVAIPVQILQAGDDTIVDNQAQLHFFQRLNPCSALEIIQGAKHELFVERDEYRQQVLSRLLAFFEKY